jgi:hypothetical protein
MANNDPVSGLYASLSRVRQRGLPGGLAAQASTAQQAGTVQPMPKAPQPLSLPPVAQVTTAQAPTPLPIPVPQPVAEAAPMPAPETPLQTPSEAPVGLEDAEVVRLATLFRRAVPEFPEDVAMALAFQYLDENTQAMPTQPGQTLV